jgi:hypothetical protein
MRRWGAGVLVVVCLCLGGCLSGEQGHTSAMLSRMHIPHTTLGPDGALVDIVLVERPLGDPFLNGELWTNTDCQVVGLEKKALLDDNGFCVGQVIGMNPAKLQNLIQSNRYCVTSRRQLLPAGTPTTVAMGPPQARCEFRVKTDDGNHDIDLDQGQCTICIVPSLTNDGRTRLKFTPQVLYGSTVPDIQVAPDRLNFLYQWKRPNKIYDALSWEVTLAPNQYLVIGTHFDENVPEDAPQSLGSQCFLQDGSGGFKQRILVIRTTRGNERGESTSVQADTGTVAGQPVSAAAHCLECAGY